MNLPIESNDDAALQMLSGANFGPNTKVTLPSGKQIDGDEANAFTSLLSPDSPASPPSRYNNRLSFDRNNPLSSANDDWTGDPAIDRQRLVQRAMAAVQQPAPRRRRWWHFFKR